jgi:hypothetical protein
MRRTLPQIIMLNAHSRETYQRQKRQMDKDRPNDKKRKKSKRVDADPVVTEGGKRLSDLNSDEMAMYMNFQI